MLKSRGTTIALICGVVLILLIGIVRISQVNSPEKNLEILLDAGFIPTPEPIDIRGFKPLLVQANGEHQEAYEFTDWSVIFSGYTYCPDICPVTLRTFDTVHYLLAPSSREKYSSAGFSVNFYMLSIDPVRDTPEQLALHLENFKADTRGLWVAPELLSVTMLLLRLAPPTTAEDSVLIDHSGQLALIDDRGRLVGHIRQNATAREITFILKQLRGQCVVADVGGCNELSSS